MSDPHDDTYDSVPLRIVGQITGPIVPIRDDTAEPFPSGNGPLTARIDAWPAPEPYPLPLSFPMPAPFDSPQQQLVDRLVVAQRRGDHATFAATLDKLCELRDIHNSNSGPVAPIQGQG